MQSSNTLELLITVAPISASFVLRNLTDLGGISPNKTVGGKRYGVEESGPISSLCGASSPAEGILPASLP
jgi:hypothetical protein